MANKRNNFSRQTMPRPISLLNSSSSPAAVVAVESKRIKSAAAFRFTRRLSVVLSLAVVVSTLSSSFVTTSELRSPVQVDKSNNNEPPLINYLLYSNSERSLLNETKLERLLKDSDHNHVSDTVDLTLANSVWKKMRQNALEFAQVKANQSRPTINKLLEQANVSSTCRKSLNDVIDRLANLDEWAVKSKWGTIE